MNNIYETIKREATQAGASRTALEDGMHALSYAQLFEHTEGIAAELKKAGVGRAARVALFCGDSIDYITGSLAILALQAVVVPVPPTSAPHELDALLERISADFLLFDEALCHRESERVAPQCFTEKSMALCAFHAAAPPPGFAELNPAFIRFSSGTTGQSKGVMLSHEAIHGRTAAANQGLEVSTDDTVLWVLSMSYHFVVSILLFLRKGATICLCYDHFPFALQSVVAQGRGTFIYAAPFHYHTMAASKAFPADGLQHIRMAISTSMKLQDDVAQAFAEKFGFGLAEAYGIIEVGLPFLNREPLKVRGSVGRMLPDYEIQLLHADSEGVGEIGLRGPGMYGAYVSPWKVREPDEWFNTGDLGYMDADGNLFISGRKKSLINFMGMKVFPDEVEAVLNAHPCVAESLVYGEPHPRYGQLPCAKVVLCGEIDSAALSTYCLQELSPHKVPKAFEVVERLEKTASGKLRRN